MLDLHNSVRVWIVHFAGTICMTAIAMSNSHLQAQEVVTAERCNPEAWLAERAERIEAEMDPQELVNLLVGLRQQLVYEGCQIPDLRAFLAHCRTYLSNHGFFIKDEVFEALEAEFEAFGESDSFLKTKHRSKKKKDKEIRVNAKTAVGFLKFVAGGLLCLVPVPVVQGLGVGLAVLGVSEMADGAREQADASEINQDNQRLNREL